MGYKYFGTTISGSEFGQTDANDDGNIPGILKPLGQGGTYFYDNTPTEYQYFFNKGLTIFRLPFLWERLVRTRGSGLISEPDILGLKSMLDAVQAVGGKAILDMHNYSRYNVNGTVTALVAGDTTLATDWKAIASQSIINSHPALWGYEIQNEPHDLVGGGEAWAGIAQSVINSIRTVDTTHVIFVPGYQYQSVLNWVTNNPNFPLKDPNNNLIYAGHSYLDGDQSGGYYWPTGSSINPTVGSTNIASFLTWLEENNVQGIISETGIPYGPNASAGGGASFPFWVQAQNNQYKAIMASQNCIGAIHFGAGLDWGNWNNTVEPLNNGQFVHLDNNPSVPFPSVPQDQPSMAIYEQFPSTSIATTPATATTTANPSPTTPVTPPVTPPSVPTTPSTPTTVQPPTPTPTTPSAPIVTPNLDIVTTNEILTDIYAITQAIRKLFKI